MVFLYVILITQLVTPQDVISSTSGIRAHGVVWAKITRLLRSFLQLEREQYYAQGKPIKPTQMILEKDPIKEYC